MIEMDEETINKKHKRIRGSDEFKYPPNASRCKQTCGIAHDWVRDMEGREHPRQHRCFLSLDHEGFCEFSSACGEMRIRPVVSAVSHETFSSLADDGFSTLAQHFES